MKALKNIDLVVNFLRLTLVVAAVVALFYGSWTNVFLAFLTLILTFLPIWFEKRYRIDIPLDFELVIIVFIYASLFLGEIGNFYEYFWWWDLLLHAGSAIAFACIGFVILFILFEIKNIKTHPAWLAIFSFCFAVAVGVIWEIYEFGMDQLFGLNMQKTGLMDTMWDLIIDCVGALITALAGYSYLKGSRYSLLSRIMNLFFKANPRLRKID